MRTNIVLRALPVCLVVVLAASVANADIRSGLVGYYPLNEGTGTIAHDMSGSGHDGTLYNGVTWISPGYQGGGVNDNGGADSRIQLGTWDPTAGTGQLSLAMWIRWSGSTSTYQGLLGKRNIWPGTTEFQFQVRPENSGTFRLETGTYAVVSPNNTMNPLIHTWAHVAATFDGTTARLYLNGKQVASGAFALTTAGSGSVMGIGSVTGGTGLDGYTQTFSGDMDEVAIFNRALSVDEVAVVMVGLGGRKASNPRPADKATDAPRDVVLGWDPLKTAATRDVYFGAVYADVNNASRTNPGKALVSRGQAATTFAPAGLAYGQTYYWRIDEVNGTPDATIFRGDIWSLTTEPFAYPISNITATASSAQNGMGPENTINGAGLNANDQHSTDLTQMWMTTGVQPAWIQYQFDKAYKLYELWVWNSNSMLEVFMGMGAKDVKIEYSLDGNAWTELAGVPPFAQAPGLPTYTHNTTVSFGGVTAKYVKLTITKSWGVSPQTGLSEVRFFSVPVQARAPQPADGATGVSVTTDLTWRPGREAGSHKVFFGTDPNAVAKGTATAQTVTGHSFTPAALLYGTTYYWRVDEVNTVTYPGNVWKFTTTAFGVVDDFESYNDTSNRIYDTWIDGMTDGKSGSQVGYNAAPFAEQTIVHGGHQSMPLAYDNSKAPFYSETTRDLGTAQDWTANGATHMDLWFRGYAAATMAVNVTNGALTLTGDGTDIWNTADDFALAYKTLTGDGSIVARVVSVGTGTNTWAKAGVMIRADLTAGAPDAYTVISGGAGNGASFQYRLAVNGGCVNIDAAAVLPVPYWVKLTRTGSAFAGYLSPDGKTWTQQGTTQTITMTNPVVVGLCVCAHQAGEYRTMQFDNISTTGSVSSTWLGAQISSSPHNAPAGLYVAVTDNAGKTKLEVNADPAATNAINWTQWNIPLSDLTAAGLKTTAIKKITIGAGNKTSPAAGGTGIVFIDDLGLGRPIN